MNTTAAKIKSSSYIDFVALFTESLSQLCTESLSESLSQLCTESLSQLCTESVKKVNKCDHLSQAEGNNYSQVPTNSQSRSCEEKSIEEKREKVHIYIQL